MCGSKKGLSRFRHQVHSGLLIIGTLETNSSEIWIKGKNFLTPKWMSRNECGNVACKMSAISSRPQCVNMPYNRIRKCRQNDCLAVTGGVPGCRFDSIRYQKRLATFRFHIRNHRKTHLLTHYPPSDAIWWHRYWPIMARIIAWCPMAPRPLPEPLLTLNHWHTSTMS